MSAVAEKQFDLYAMGITAVDEIVELPGYPASGSKMPVVRTSRQCGGICTTALVTAARLGLRCMFGGLLGRNELSDFVRGTLEREGIATPEAVPYPDARPYHSTILVEQASGERTILFSNEGVVEPVPADIRADLLLGSRAFFADWLGPAATLQACRLAKAHGIPIIADMEHVLCDDVRAIIELTDHLIVPLNLAAEITGTDQPEAALKGLARAGRALTAVTGGTRGCWYVEGAGAMRHQPAFEVRVVDTTGCGDVFHGAYAAAHCWGYPASRAIRFASATAALKATRSGGQAGIPDRQAVEKFLAQND